MKYSPLTISSPLHAALVRLRTKQLTRSRPDEFFEQNEVVILTLGFGPAIYLALDGEIIVWNYMNDEEPRPAHSLEEAAAGIVIGATKNDMPQLLDLLPACPADRQTCSRCRGSRRWSFGEDNKVDVVCPTCSGLGWEPA